MVKFVTSRRLLKSIPTTIVAETDALIPDEVAKYSTKPLTVRRLTRDIFEFRRDKRIFCVATRVIQQPDTKDLDYLNSLRAQRGKPPLSNWFSGKAALSIAIQNEERKPTPNVAKEIEMIITGKIPKVKRYAPGVARGAYRTKSEAIDTVGKAPRKPNAKMPKPVSVTRASTVLNELGIEPRRGRALLRKHNIPRDDPAAIRRFFKLLER